MKKILLSMIILFVAVVLIGCESKTTKINNLPDISSVGSFENYDQLKSYLSQFYEKNDGYYSLKGGLRFFTTDVLLESVGAIADNVDYTSDSNGNNFSQTNTQVDGVDESDTVITDGDYIYLVTMGKFVIINVDTLEILYTYKADNLYIETMYIQDNRVVLIGNESHPIEVDKKDEEVRDYYFYYWYQSGVKVLILDIENKENVTVAKELYFDQSYLSQSRMIDGQLYLIMNNYFVNYGYLEDNFVPFYQDSVVSDDNILIPAENIYYIPNDNYSMSYLLIASLNIFDDSQAQVDAYIGSSYQIYMSANNLYSVVYRSTLDEVTGYYDYNTYVLRFEIEEGKLVYKAMGGIEGSPLNQFSMDEYEGTFRIATTDWVWNNEGSTVNNQLFILDATTEEEMDFISVLGGLGKPGERIYSVRFSGETAFVVTFVNTDPLYKLDLSNPSEPKIVGELFENGVSDYLHEMNDKIMIGVGRQANDLGRFQGVKISIYNTEGDDPVNIDTYFIEGLYSYTPVTYDHKMFIYYEPVDADYWYVAIPVFEYGLISQYDYRYTQNLYVFKITFEGDLTLASKLAISTEHSVYDDYYYDDYLLRGLFINDSVYSISSRTVRQYDIYNNFELVKSLILE